MATAKRAQTDYKVMLEDYMNTPVEMIDISDIVLNQFNVRRDLGIDETNVARLKATLLSGATLPPIGVVRLSNGKFEYLWGRHRQHAHEELSADDARYKKIAAIVIPETSLSFVDRIGLGSAENELSFDHGANGKWVARESHGPMAHKIEDYVSQIVRLRSLGVVTPKEITAVLPLAPQQMLKDALHIADSQIRNRQQALAIRDTTRFLESDGEEGFSMKEAWKTYFQKGGRGNPAGICRSYPAFKKLIQRHAPDPKTPGNAEDFINSISGNFASTMKNVTQTINRKLGAEVLDHYESGAIGLPDVEKIFSIFKGKLKSALSSVEKRHKEFTDRQTFPEG